MKFSPKYPRSAGKLVVESITGAQLIQLFTNEKFLYEGQRDHGKNAPKKRHTQGPLKGDSQLFAGAYCKELGRYVVLDGYHRAFAVKAENAWFLPGYEIQLTSHYVETVAELDALYEQYNSAAAAKKATCYFESGLRAAKILPRVTSEQIMKGAKAYAVQLASGLKGTTKVKAAVLKLKKGILLVNDLQLSRQRHEMAGVLGAFFAIAEHCPDADLAIDFIVNLNSKAFRPLRATAATRVISSYHELLTSGALGTTGGTPNAVVFQHGLSAFVNFAAARKGRSVPTESMMTLAQFIEKMEAMTPKVTRR